MGDWRQNTDAAAWRVLILVTFALGFSAATAWGLPSQDPNPPASPPLETQEVQETQEGGGAAPEQEGPRSVLYWDQGLHLDWKALELQIAGAASNDSAAFAGVSEDLDEAVGPIENGVEWRRARVWAEGRFYKRINWKFQYDFAVNSPPQLKDAYMGILLPDFGLGSWQFRGGRFNAPMSLEGYTSGNNTTFMERGVVAAFIPSRNTGFVLQGSTPRLRRKIHWNIGYIQPEDELGTTDTDNAGVAGRFTYAFNPGGGDLLVHLGADYMRRNVDDTMNYLSRPESHLAPSFVDTGDIPAVAANTVNLEAAVVNGPLSVQGELAWSRVEATDGSADPNFYAFYVYTSYFISGETRPYEEERGAFGRIVPTSEFRGSEGGAGALEVAVRFSRIDLTDEEVEGGIMNDATVAFNWYASRNGRVSTNVIHSRVEGFDPVWIFQVRLQWAY